MSTKIKGAEYPLAKIFSSDFDYSIPAYQRPYAWTEEETEILFDDLYGFYTDESAEESYFLGSIVLIKDDDKPALEERRPKLFQERLKTEAKKKAELDAIIQRHVEEEIVKRLAAKKNQEKELGLTFKLTEYENWNSKRN